MMEEKGKINLGKLISVDDADGLGAATIGKIGRRYGRGKYE